MNEITRSQIGVMTYLAPSGSLVDEQASERLAALLNECHQSRHLQIVVDLAAVSFISSKTIAVLLDAQDELFRQGGWIKVANANTLLQDIFRITGFHLYIGLVENPDRDLTGAADAEPEQAPAKLGDILVRRGLISSEQLNQAIEKQLSTGRRMGQIITAEGWVSDKDMLLALAEQLELPYVNLRPGLYDPQVLRCVDRATARRLLVVPLFKIRGVLTLATSDPQAMPILDEVEELAGCRVQPVISSREEIAAIIQEGYELDHNQLEFVEDVNEDFELVETHTIDDASVIDEMAAGSPVINTINAIIQRAVRDGASDIHLEPFRAKSRVRFRIDGVLYEVMTPKVEMHAALVSRLKVMANLDIAERRLPQDGRIQVTTQGRAVDLRFSSLPGIFGEKVVLRVLDRNNTILDIEKLGMQGGNLSTLTTLLERSYGLILVTGPTGSGKTTTLYAGLNYMNSLERSIVTIEDPVEYQLDSVNQNQTKDIIDLSFAKMLKHVLRQDPDIIMVGEIRERETAEIAVQAALTGHLVLSTLHTNDSVSAITRMVDMGVEPYLLSSALIGVIAQRLVRTICPECKTQFVAPPDLVERFGWDKEKTIRLAKGRGCQSCYDSGYKGRAGIHEVLVADAALQRMIMHNPSRDELLEHAAQQGMRTLYDDGLQRVLEGLTTVEEIGRVVNA